MGSIRITIEVPDALHERLVNVARQTDTPLNGTIVRLIEQALTTDAQVARPDGEATRTDGEAAHAELLSRRDQEVARIRAALGPLAEQPEDRERPKKSPLDALSAAEFRRRMPILDPPLSQTIIEGREDRF